MLIYYLVLCRSGVPGQAKLCSSQGITRLTQSYGPAGLLSGSVRREPAFKFIQVSAEFSSLQVWDGGPRFLAGCQPGTVVSSKKLPTFLLMWPLPSSNKQSTSMSMRSQAPKRSDFLFFDQLKKVLLF